MDNLDLALRYADDGYLVCPIYTNSKIPALPNGFSGATSDPDRLSKWFSNKTLNIGIKIDSFCVIDVDDKESEFFKHFRDNLFDASNAICQTRRGYHFYFKTDGIPTTTTSYSIGFDLKLTGGVITPISKIDGCTYTWLKELPPKEKLARLPDNIISYVKEKLLITNEHKTEEQADKFVEGQRDNALFRLASQLRRLGLSESEMVACLLEVNKHRCQPPLPDKQVIQKAKSACRYKAESLHVWKPSSVEEPPQSLTISDQLDSDASDIVVNGILRKKEIMNIIAPPKTGKSWLVADLATAIATGTPWLNLFKTKKSKVLLIDNELRYEMICRRFREIVEAKKLPYEDVVDNVKIKVLRGFQSKIDDMTNFFQNISGDGYNLVIIDALYKSLPDWCDENRNSTISRVYSLIDRYAEITGAAFVIVHHTSKGIQANKAVTDVGAGAGSVSRSVDSHIILRQHAVQGAMVFDGVFRSFEGIPPFCIRWQYPLWIHDPKLNADHLKKSESDRIIIPGEEELQAVLSVLNKTEEGMTVHDVVRQLVRTEARLISVPMANACLSELVRSNKVILTAGVNGPSYKRVV